MRVSKSYKMLAGVFIASGTIVAGGCSDDPQPVRTGAAEQPGVISAAVVLDAPPEKVSNLLNFETPTDAVFVTTDPPNGAAIATGERHGGASALKVAAGTSSMTVKLSSLLSGRQFPADWTLLGG